MAKKRNFREYLNLGSLSADLVLGNFTFVIFLAFLAIIYIANALYSERKVREIQSVEKELKEMRWHYTALKSDVMFASKQSEIEKDVEALGLRSINNRINKIVIEK